MLVAKYHQSNCTDKEILGSIDKAIKSSLALRSKKELIETFISKINDNIFLSLKIFPIETIKSFWACSPTICSPNGYFWIKRREVDLLIVVNMFLTGFDATTLNTLWVDKNLKQHGLIQAYSRTNRIFP